MIAQLLPSSRSKPRLGGAGSAAAGARADGRPGRPRVGVEGGWQDGPLRVPPYAPSGCQRARVGTGLVSGGPRPRRLRRPLLLPGARSSGDRCGRQYAAGGDRSPDRVLLALFGTARAVLTCPLRHQRDLEDGRRRPRGAHRSAQSPRRDQRGCRVRWSGPQISHLGTRPLSRRIDRGHRQGSCLQGRNWKAGGGGQAAWSTGMRTGSDGTAVAGGLARHIPVLAGSVVDWLKVHAGGVYVDATFGAGGYARAILRTSGTRVIGIDRDPSAVAGGAPLLRESHDRLRLIEDRFSNLDAVVAGNGVAAVDGVVFDLGVSSLQLDEAARGFS